MQDVNLRDQGLRMTKALCGISNARNFATGVACGIHQLCVLWSSLLINPMRPESRLAKPMNKNYHIHPITLNDA